MLMVIKHSPQQQLINPLHSYLFPTLYGASHNPLKVPKHRVVLFNNLITCSSISSLSITLSSGYLQGEIVLEIRDLYVFLCSGSLNLILWLQVVDCFLHHFRSLQSPYLSSLMPLTLTWLGVDFGWRLGLGKVLVGKGWFIDGAVV